MEVPSNAFNQILGLQQWQLPLTLEQKSIASKVASSTVWQTSFVCGCYFCHFSPRFHYNISIIFWTFLSDILYN